LGGGVDKSKLGRSRGRNTPVGDPVGQIKLYKNGQYTVGSGSIGEEERYVLLCMRAETASRQVRAIHS